MGRIHRYGQRKDCLIFNFVATNTVEGRVLQRLLEKLQAIRNALDDDAVFNVVGEVLPASQIERVLRDYYAGKLGEEDLEEKLLRNVDEGKFRDICRNALEGLATKKLNLEMLVERKARAQEKRVVPETISRFIQEAAPFAHLTIKPAAKLPHAFDPAKTPSKLRRYESQPNWKLPALAVKYPRCSTDRETAEKNHLEWVTPGHPLFEALRRHTLDSAREAFGKGACLYSIQHDAPERLDFYQARVVDGLGHTIREQLFVLRLSENGEPRLQDPAVLGNLILGEIPEELPSTATLPEAVSWLNEHALNPFLDEVKTERQAEVKRIKAHVELALTELIQRADDEIGRAAAEVENKAHGAEGRLAQAETRHSELIQRRDRRRQELERQGALSLQAVERMTSVLVLPHPEREKPEVKRMRPDLKTEAISMKVVIEHEESLGRKVFDVHEQNLGYDITSLDLNSGELRLIEVKGIGAATGTILLTPNERRVAEDRRDCYWLYIVTNCNTNPELQKPVKDPARLEWHEVKKVAHYYLSVNAATQPMQVREDDTQYGVKK